MPGTGSLIIQRQSPRRSRTLPESRRAASPTGPPPTQRPSDEPAYQAEQHAQGRGLARAAGFVACPVPLAVCPAAGSWSPWPGRGPVPDPPRRTRGRRGGRGQPPPRRGHGAAGQGAAAVAATAADAAGLFDPHLGRSRRSTRSATRCEKPASAATTQPPARRRRPGGARPQRRRRRDPHAGRFPCP